MRMRGVRPLLSRRGGHRTLQTMTSDTPPPSFEQSLQELERLVKTLEEGKIPLEQAIQLYERGHTLSQHCTTMLQNAQLKIEHIRTKDTQDSSS